MAKLLVSVHVGKMKILSDQKGRRGGFVISPKLNQEIMPQLTVELKRITKTSAKENA